MSQALRVRVFVPRCGNGVGTVTLHTYTYKKVATRHLATDSLEQYAEYTNTNPHLVLLRRLAASESWLYSNTSLPGEKSDASDFMDVLSTKNKSLHKRELQ